MLASLVPERQLNSIPESQFVKDDTKVVLHDIFGSADNFGYLAIFRAPGRPTQ